MRCSSECAGKAAGDRNELLVARVRERATVGCCGGKQQMVTCNDKGNGKRVRESVPATRLSESR